MALLRKTTKSPKKPARHVLIYRLRASGFSTLRWNMAHLQATYDALAMKNGDFHGYVAEIEGNISQSCSFLMFPGLHSLEPLQLTSYNSATFQPTKVELSVAETGKSKRKPPIINSCLVLPCLTPWTGCVCPCVDILPDITSCAKHLLSPSQLRAFSSNIRKMLF